MTPDRDRVLVDRRLYLPRDSWPAEPARCAAAGIPSDLAFKTRPQQVIEMIQAARAAGMPFAWFTADEEFDQNPGLCQFLEEDRIPYVMAVPKNTQFTDTKGDVAQVDKLAQQLPRNTWQRRACGIGTKGHRVYDWALINSHDPDHQYLIRRSTDHGESLSTAATTHTAPASPNSSVWPERAGPSKNASDPAKTKSDSTTTIV